MRESAAFRSQCNIIDIKVQKHSAGSNLFLRNRVVGPRERILMKNDNKKKFRKNPELFNGETWGGAASL